jgi:hypothetical protein
MGDVFIKLSVEEKQAVEAMRRVAKEQDGIAEAVKKANDEWKKWERSMESAGKAGEQAMQATKNSTQPTTNALTEMNSGLEVIKKTVGVLGDAFERELARMETKVRNFLQTSEALRAGMALAGGVELMPEVRKELVKAGGGRFTEQQMATLFTSISQAGGSEVGLQTKLEATREAATADRAGFSTEDFGKTFVELRKTAMKDLDSSDVGDATAKILTETQGKGLDTGQVRVMNRLMASAKARGIPAKQAAIQALELIMSASRNEEDSKGLSKLVDEGERTITESDYKGHEELSPEDESRKKQIGEERRSIDARQLSIEQSAKGGKLSRAQSREMGELRNQDRALSLELSTLGARKISVQTPDQARLERLAQIPQEQRLNAMLDDPTLAPDAMRARVRNLAEGMQSGELQDAMEGDFFGSRLAAGMQMQNSSAVGMALERKRRADVKKAYQLSNPNAEDAARAANLAEGEQRMQSDTAEGAALRALDAIPGTSSLMRAKLSGLGEFEGRRSTLVEIAPTRPVVSRNGGN